LQPVDGSTAQALAYIKEQTQIWGDAVRRAGVRPH